MNLPLSRPSGALSPSEGERDGVRGPFAGSGAQCMRKNERGLSMNQPTPDPAREGSRRLSAAGRFPSWEGLGVGSGSECMRKNERGLSMNLHFSTIDKPPALPLTPTSGTLSPSEGERDGVRGPFAGSGAQCAHKVRRVLSPTLSSTRGRRGSFIGCDLAEL